MRIAHLTDLHVTEGPRLDDHAADLARIVDAALAAGPDLVLLTGDLYGRTVPHRSTPAEREVLYPQIARLAERCPVVVVAGNHDHPVDVAGLRHVRGAWPIHVALRTWRLDVDTPHGAASVYCLPYPTRRVLLDGQDVPPGLQATADAVHARLDALFAGWRAEIAAARGDDPSRVLLLAAHVQVRGSRTSGGEVLAGQEIEVGADELAALGVDYGALGHIHLRQEVGPRIWYAGSPWRNDFSETELSKGWHLVDLGQAAEADDYERPAGWEWGDFKPATEGRLTMMLHFLPTGCRPFLTLDYRWDTTEGEVDGAPGWYRRPSEEDLAAVAGAEVRMRLTVPAHFRPTCPWDEEVERVRALAHRVTVEPKVEAVQRVRAAGIVAARSVAEQVEVYFDTLADGPTTPERERARERLQDIEDEIAETAAAPATAA